MQNKTSRATTRVFIIVSFYLVCLTGVLLAQTFHYSRGWTNGKKRSPVLFSVDDQSEEPESFGICEMQRLKHFLNHRYHSEVNLPCEVFEGVEEDISRLRRNGGFEGLFATDSFIKK